MKQKIPIAAIITGKPKGMSPAAGPSMKSHRFLPILFQTVNCPQN
nr:MAG TPA: hypothetical protein [Caudoviricetes sp.]